MNGNILEEKYNQYAPYSEQIWIPFLFQGQYYDFDTELAYNRFRYYSPELGRYISEDPIRFESGTLALHSYVEDSNSWIDAFGLKTYSAGSLQKKVERGQAPLEIDRFDPPHSSTGKPHVHFKDGTSMNIDGTPHDKGKGVPNPLRKTKEFLEKHGWESQLL